MGDEGPKGLKGVGSPELPAGTEDVADVGLSVYARRCCVLGPLSIPSTLAWVLPLRLGGSSCMGVVVADPVAGIKYVPAPRSIASRFLPLLAAKFDFLVGGGALPSTSSFFSGVSSVKSGTRESV